MKCHVTPLTPVPMNMRTFLDRTPWETERRTEGWMDGWMDSEKDDVPLPLLVVMFSQCFVTASANEMVMKAQEDEEVGV